METHYRPLEDLIARERTAVASLVESMKRFGASGEDIEDAQDALRRVKDLSLVVVAGEFDSGKSAFIDALIGVGPGIRDVAPATGWITLLRHGPNVLERTLEAGLVEKTLPAPFLQQVTVADTPVTNAILRRGAEASLDFARRADTILFITSAEHALTESGREFLRLLREVAPKVVVVVNKMDLLADVADVEEVRHSVEEGAREDLGVTPPVLFVSSFLGGKARASGGAIEGWSLLVKSGFAALEDCVMESIGGTVRTELAMQVALGVAEKLGIRYKFAVDQHIGLLDEDLKTYANAGSQLEAYRTDMRRDYEARTAQIENIISLMNHRAGQWFERKIRLANAAELARGEKVREEFEREVVVPTEAMVHAWIEELARWMVERNRERWRSLVEYVAKRRRMEYVERLMGSLEVLIEPEAREAKNGTSATGFVGEDAVGLVRGDDSERELTGISASLRSAVARVAAAEVGAIGMGGVAVASMTLAATLAVPLTLGTVLLGACGLFVIPNRRRGAYDEFRERSAILRDRLDEVVRKQFEAEIDASVGRMHAAMKPHVRFLLAEKERVGKIRSSLDDVDAELEAIRDEIDALQTEPAEAPEPSRTAV